jgi:hypothetical protein
VGRDAHDRARAVLHQDVIGDPDRDRLLRRRIDHVAAREDAVLLLLLALDRRAPARTAGVLEHLGFVLAAGHQSRDERMLRREHEERRAEERVRPRREDRDLLVEPVDLKADLGAFGATDPVALHGQHALGPVLEQVHLLEERIRVVGDLEEPLFEVARLDLGAAALAAAVDHLFVRENGLIVRAPLDGRLPAVGEPALKEAQEEPLRPAVVLGLVAGEHAIPVDRPAHPLHLRADRGDVPLGHLARMPALADGGVLGREPERVEAHRPEHGEAHAPPVVRDDLAQHVVAHVPHVELAGGVRKHLEHVRLAGLLRGTGLAGVRDVEGAFAPPYVLPLLLDRLRVVPLHRSLFHSAPDTEKPLDREAQGSRGRRRSPAATPVAR